MTFCNWIVYSLIRGNIIASYELKADADRRAGSRRKRPSFGVIHKDEAGIWSDPVYGWSVGGKPA